MISAIDKNLERGIKLLNSITDQQYADCSIAPYYSSIGNHIRHILDIFSCIFNGLDSGVIDFSKRERNILAQTQTKAGIDYFNTVRKQLQSLNPSDFNKIIEVKDDLGLGMFTSKYTLSSALIQAHSHAIHHYASLGFIIYQLEIDLPDADFGFNPTTPKVQEA